MDNSTFISHPRNAQEANHFQQQQLPASASYPNGIGHLTPPLNEKDAPIKGGSVNGQVNGNASQQNGVVPNTPAATPGANAGAVGNASGIVPTLQ